MRVWGKEVTFDRTLEIICIILEYFASKFRSLVPMWIFWR